MSPINRFVLLKALRRRLLILFSCLHKAASLNSPALLLTLAGMLFLAHLCFGGLVQAACLNDHAFACDYTYRIYSGQLPFRDFHTAVGSFPFVLSAAFWHLAGAHYANLTKAWGIFGFLFALVTYFVCGRRLGQALGAVYAFCVFLLLSGLNRLDDGATMLSVAMIYNRFGWAFVAAILPLLFFRSEEKSRRERFLAGVFSGLCLFAAVFCKINFFAAGLFMLAGSVLAKWGRPQTVFFAGTAAGFTICALAGWFTGVFSLPDYLHEVKILAQSSRPASFFYYSLSSNLRYGLEVSALTVCLLGAVLLARYSTAARIPVLKAVKAGAVFMYITAGGLAFSATNNEKSVIVLMPFAALVFIALLTENLGPGWARLRRGAARGALVLTSAALFLLCGKWAPTSLISVPFSALASVTAQMAGRADKQIDLPNSRGVYFVPKGAGGSRRDDRFVAPEEYTAWASRAADLLRQFGIKDSCVVLSSFNPADFLAGVRPATGVPINWVLGEFLKERDLPELKPGNGHRFLLAPKKIFTESDLALADHYRRRLGNRLLLLGENKYWILYEIQKNEGLDDDRDSRV